jgi:outer membrane receptor protein involved in Fe transport
MSPSSTFSPRLGVHLEISDDTELRASIGRFFQSQTINELQISDGITAFFEPQRSEHMVFGLHHRIRRGLAFRVEAYEKRMGNLRPRFENLLNNRVLLPELKPDRIRINPDGATARGIEFLLESSSLARLDWWVSYGWSAVSDRVDGRDIRRSWDQPHAIGGGLTLDAGGWDIGLALNYRSGWPTTPIGLAGVAGVEEVPVVTASSVNAARRGHSASLDLRFARAFALEQSTLSLTIELTNLFDRSNPCCTEYEIGDADEAGLLLLKELSYVPVVPSIGFLWQF